MNQAIYQLADRGGSIRIVVQKKTDESYILGISNGKDKPMIRQGGMNDVDTEFEAALPGYLEALKNAEIEAKLRAAEESAKPVSAPNTIPHQEAENKKEEQLELDFGF